MKDYCKILGVSSNSSKEEIDQAYRALALKYHPDRNQDNQNYYIAKFKEIQEAYEFLIKTRYNVRFDFKNKNPIDNIFENMFSKFFGNQKNDCSKIRIKISLEEAFHGCVKNILVDKHAFCDNCQGTGGISWEHCERCFGKGFIYDNSDKMVIQTGCSYCFSKGSVIKEKCIDCRGQGFLNLQPKSLDFEIPAGIKDGSQIRIENEGSGGGDLYVIINIEKHSHFKRDDQNLIFDLELFYSTLFLGGKVNFDFFGKDLEVSVKPRTKPESKIIIKNKGLPFMENNNIKGDLILNIKLRFPNSSKEYNKAIRDLSNLEK